ncbi:glycoside hydrolase family 108 protein [Dyella ginsengisoli]|uniref:Glycoside hydrolase family 108 protein n=1 Tax=Dyella ginsengisoli TaxID=363848 RepID=A0ABW8JV49_9GAMM
MAAGNFQASLALTLPFEGGWSDHPKDPGGATMCGITQAVYDDDRDARGLPRRSVRESTAAEREAIYLRRYWQKAQCEALPAGADFALFDFAVNSGVSRATRTLQRIVGVAADGIPGRYTLAAASRYGSQYGPSALGDALCHARLAWMQALPTYATFGHGWRRRVMGEHDGAQLDDTGVIDHAFSMATGATVAATQRPLVVPKTYLARAA